MSTTASFSRQRQELTGRHCSWSFTTGIIATYFILIMSFLWDAEAEIAEVVIHSNKVICLPCRSTRDSSCFTVVLNNLRVFLIFDWLQLVRDFLKMPVEKVPGYSRQRWPSNTSTDSANSSTSTTGAVMPKTVKSGVVTKRSTVPVNQEHCLEVKINVTGQRQQKCCC